MNRPGKHLRPVGAGVDGAWRGDACVARVPLPMGDASVPTPHNPSPAFTSRFFSCRLGSVCLPVGAGVDEAWGGDACVALVLIPRAPFLSSQGDASVPTHHPNHSRPYGDDACPLQKPTSESPSPAPTRTLCLLNNPGFSWLLC